MPNPTFPTLASGEDSKNHGMTPEDPTIRYEMEGGYVYTRARHTRQPRRTWTGGYTYIDGTDKKALENFWDQVTGAVIFDWTNPEDDNTYQVRFKGPPKFKYVGIGNNRRWDIQFEVEQA